MKGYSTFLKAPALLELHHQIISCHIQDTRWGKSYPSIGMQSVYSTDPTDWATFPKGISLKVNVIARLELDLVFFETAVHHTTEINRQSQIGSKLLYSRLCSNPQEINSANGIQTVSGVHSILHCMLGASGGVMVSKARLANLHEVILSLIGCPFHMALCHI